jgi:hypothetical protein
MSKALGVSRRITLYRLWPCGDFLPSHILRYCFESRLLDDDYDILAYSRCYGEHLSAT